MLVHVGHSASLSCGSTTQLIIAMLAQPHVLLDSLLDLFFQYLDGLVFSCLFATTLLAGVAGLFFEASGNLQTPLTQRKASKKREVAAQNALGNII